MKSILVSKLSETAKIPTRKHPTDAGLDLYSDTSLEIPAFSFAVVKTGISIKLPEGYAGIIKPKSRNNYLIGAGVVDQDYQGEILVKIINPYNAILMITEGDAIAQLLLIKVETPLPEEVPLENLFEEKTERGSSGGIHETV